MKKITALFIAILLLLTFSACSKDVEFTNIPAYEFSTSELKTKEFDEVVITYPAYMDILMESEKLSYDGKGDLELEYYDEDTEDYSWVSLLTVALDEGVRASDITQIELKLLVADFEDPVELVSLEHFLIDGYESFLARFDMVDPFYDEFGTEYWMVGIYDYESSVLYSLNVQCDAGICNEDCLAILSHLDFK